MYNGKKWEYNPLNLKNLWNVFRYFIKEMGLTFAVPERTWYDYFNPEAYGNHIYPSGIHKYYDLYSLDGYWLFFSDYLIALLFLEPIQMFFWLFFPLNQIPIEVTYWWTQMGLSNYEQTFYVMAIKIYFWWCYPVIRGSLPIPVERDFYYDG